MDVIDELPKNVVYSNNEIDGILNKKISQKELLTEHITRLRTMKKSVNSFKFKRASLKKRRKSKKKKSKRKSSKRKNK